MARSGGNWDQDRYTQVDVVNAHQSGFVAGTVDMTPSNLEDEAEADRAAGRPTWGTRGMADTEAFERDSD